MSSPSGSPRLRQELERIAGERLEAERQIQRTYRWELFRVCIECLTGAAIGAVCMGFGLHVTGRDVGEIFWWGGMLLGYVLITISLMTAYQRGEERGDW
ncbi:MAG: hypothetical protein ABI442_17165 [Gemmatimonadaceae bacterium]